MTAKLPRRGPVDHYASVHAVLDRQGFLAALDGRAVLVRLDERGGRDEPSPWAFHGGGLGRQVDIKPSALAGAASIQPITPDADEDPTRTREIDASTLSGPGFALSIPAARGRATVHVIPHGLTASIGRERMCDVVVDERSISRRHAVLTDQGGGLRISEVGLTNGVTVNGTRLPMDADAALASGDLVELGDVTLMFLDSAVFWTSLPRLLDG